MDKKYSTIDQPNKHEKEDENFSPTSSESEEGYSEANTVSPLESRSSRHGGTNDQLHTSVSDDDVIAVSKLRTKLPSRRKRLINMEESQAVVEGEDPLVETPNNNIDSSVEKLEGESSEESLLSSDNIEVNSRVESRRRTEIGDVEQRDYSLAEVEKHEESKEMSRRQLRKQKKKEQEREKGLKKAKRGRIRLFPIWLRLIVVIGLLAGSLVAGAMFGFGIMGEGEPREILELESWYRIYDIIFDGTELERVR